MACLLCGAALLLVTVADVLLSRRDSNPAAQGPPASCRRVVVRGAVQRPGAVCQAGPLALAETLAAAGGARCRLTGTGREVWPGDRVQIGELSDGSCAVGVVPLSGAAQLTLGSRLDVNRVSAADLEAVPGLGPRLATAVIDTRTSLGRFGTPVDLEEVPGIGPVLRRKLGRYVEVR